MNPFGTLMSADDALDLILAKLKPVSDVETVALGEAFERVLAEDVKSTVNVPAFDRAAMDGYAVMASDLAEPRMLKLVGAAYAGKPFGKAIKDGECVEIATGAPIPKGADAVVPVENTVKVGQAIQFKVGVKRGDSISVKAEDIAKGDVVVKKGERLGPGQLAAVAITGRDKVKVYRRPSVLLFTTGDEVVPPGEKLGNGQVYDCNSFAMMSVAKRAGADVTYKPTIKDNEAALRKALVEGAKKHDMVVFSGGTSVGNKDLGYELLNDLGDVFVRGIAIKPGKPVLFGKIGTCGVFGMPGNPTSCLLTSELFLAPAIKRIAQIEDHGKKTLRAKLAHELKQDKTKHLLIPVRVDENDLAHSTFKGSGNISSLSTSVGYITLEPGDGTAAKGSEHVVNVIR